MGITGTIMVRNRGHWLVKRCGIGPATVYVLTGQIKPCHTKWILDLQITVWQMLDLKYSVLNASHL